MSASRTAVFRRYLRVNAFRRGLLGGQRGWQALFVGLLLVKQLDKVLKRGEIPLRFSEKLELGEALVIRHLAPEPRGRKARKARRRAG